MYIVVIHRRQAADSALVQVLAGALQAAAFDARQRLIGRGPAVVATFAAPEAAKILIERLQQGGISGFLVDSRILGTENFGLYVQRFQLAPDQLHIEDLDGQRNRIPFSEVDLLVTATRISGETTSQRVSGRKFSLGKTLLAGGVPLTKKVEYREVVTNEERERVLYLCAGRYPRLIFSQGTLAYDGLEDRLQPSRAMNFNTLVAELRRRCPAAVYDDCLLSRANQASLLGPRLQPDTNLDLAVEILARATAEPPGEEPPAPA